LKKSSVFFQFTFIFIPRPYALLFGGGRRIINECDTRHRGKHLFLRFIYLDSALSTLQLTLHRAPLRFKSRKRDFFSLPETDFYGCSLHWK